MTLSTSTRATLLPFLVVSLALASHTGAATAQGKGQGNKQSRRSLHTAPTVTRSGDVAVIEDDGTLLIPPNLVDLAGHGIDFKRRKDGLRATIRNSVSLKEDLGSKLDMALSTSVFVEFPTRFQFPFFGSKYDGVYVNSDGNLTFTQPDTVSLDTNSVARVLTGPPRIAALFYKLDPSKAEGTAGIYSKRTAKSLQITWLRVPQWARMRGRQRENTFQVTLFKSGRILIAYGELGLLPPAGGREPRSGHRSAVVGVAPGGGGELELLDYTADLPVATTNRALLERFNRSPVLDDQAVAQAFYSRFADVYDQLIVWLDFPFVGGGQIEVGALLVAPFYFPGYALMPSNPVQGIGRDLYDLSAAYGSDGNLRGYAQMGELAFYSLDPTEDVCVPQGVDPTDLGSENVDACTGKNTWGAVAHAVGHRWLSYVRFRDAEGNASDQLREFDVLEWGLGPTPMSLETHWSSLVGGLSSVVASRRAILDSDASIMGGYDLRCDRGIPCVAIDANEGYSRLDRYLMGLIPAQQVGDISLVTDVTDMVGFDSAPDGLGSFNGTTLDLSVDDIIAIEGERVPSSKDAPKRFKMAFIVVGLEGEPPSKASIDKVNAIRKRWGPYFRKASVNGTVKTKLVERN